MGVVLTAINSIALAFSTGTVGQFLTGTVFGRLLANVAVSALRSALLRNRSSGAQRQPGIRTSQTQTGGINPANFCIGTYATEGTLVCPPMSHGSSGNIPNAFLTYVVELSDVPGQSLDGLIIDGTEAPITSNLHPTYGNEIGGRFAGHAWVKYYDGSQTTADLGLINTYGSYEGRPWISDMIGEGICYAIVTFKFNREIFDGFPKVRFITSGIPLYDARKDSTVGGVGTHRHNDRSTWEPSDNTAVQIYNIKRGIDIGGGYVWGGGADAEDLPLAEWWSEMNKADAQIALSSGGSEPQFRTGYEILAEDTPADVIDELLKATSGEVAENGGVWKLRLGGPGLPVYFFTDDDLILDEPEEYTPFRAEQEPFNAVQATYPDPETLWEPRDAPARYQGDFLLTDPAQRRVADLNLAACPFPNQVQRVMRAYVEEEQRLVRHVASLPQDALVLEQLDVASWTSERRGYSGKAFEIARAVDPLMMGKPRFTLKERDPADAAWIPDYELPIGVPDTTVVEPPVQFVENFDVTAFAIQGADGTDARPGLEMTWTGIKADLQGIQFQIEAADGSTILTASTVDTESGVYRHSAGIEAAKAYLVRPRFLANRPTGWGPAVAVTALDLKITPDDLDDTTFEVAGLSVFGGALQSDNFITGQSGWRIGQDGSMEVQSLVTRDWIVEGALSDGADGAAAGGTHAGNDTTVLAFPVGAIRPQDLWHLTFSGRFRLGGEQWTSYVEGSEQEIRWRRRRYQVRGLVQYRGEVSGVWQDWETFFDTGLYEADWQTFQHVSHFLGDFDNAEVRVLIQEFSYVISGFPSQQGPNSYPQANWADLNLTARAAVS
ncbi:MAG: phage tail protein [Pseudomonadota bacterium]